MQGNAFAEHSVGYDLFYGFGTSINYVTAYAYLNLATGQGDELAATHLASLSQQMTPEQIAQAQQLSASFVPKKERTVANSSGNAVGARTGTGSETSKQTRPKLKATGSGFAVTQNGYVLTNCHVIKDASLILIKTADAVVPAKVIAKDEANDVALLKADGKFQPIPISTSRDVRLGQSVFTVGFPDIQLQGLEPKLTRGDISSLAGPSDDARYFQISVPLQPGNSGGPLVDAQGNVVGITCGALDDAKTFNITGSLPQSVNYAVKSAYVLALLESHPDIMAQRPEPHTEKARAFEDVVAEAERSTLIILIF